MSDSTAALTQILKTCTALQATVKDKLDALDARFNVLDSKVAELNARQVATTTDVLERLNAIQIAIVEAANKPATSRTKKPAADPAAAKEAETTQAAQPTDPVKLTPAMFFKKAYTEEHCSNKIGQVRTLVISLNATDESGTTSSLEDFVINDKDSVEANTKTLQEIKNLPEGPQKVNVMTKFYGGVAVKIFRNLDKATKETIKKMIPTYQWVSTSDAK